MGSYHLKVENKKICLCLIIKANITNLACICKFLNGFTNYKDLILFHRLAMCFFNNYNFDSFTLDASCCVGYYHFLDFIYINGF